MLKLNQVQNAKQQDLLVIQCDLGQDFSGDVKLS